MSDDVETLGIVAPAACAEAFGLLAEPGRLLPTPGDVRAGPFAEALARTDSRLWVAKMDGAIVGFATLILDAVDPIRRRAGGALLSRLYLLGPACTLGLGRGLLEVAADAAGHHGARYVWLESVAAADRALGTYADWGFCEIGRTRFEKPVRPELDGMIVMARELR